MNIKTGKLHHLYKCRLLRDLAAELTVDWAVIRDNNLPMAGLLAHFNEVNTEVINSFK